MTEGREEAIRVDVLLDRLCLTRSRSEAKSACDAGAVRIDGDPVKASRTVGPGERIAIAFPGSTLEIEVLTIPPKSTSKKTAREMYRVVGEERAG